MRVLMLATYFPKPLNTLMGNWALRQAQALHRQGVEMEVVSFTSWVPMLVAKTPGAAAYAHSPQVCDWEGLLVHYPRWPVYPPGKLGPLRRLAEGSPLPFLHAGWLVAGPWLKRYVARCQPDLVYAHHTAVNGYLAERLHRRFGLPYVVTDHDFGEITSCAQWPDRRKLFERVTRSAAMMVAVASRMERTMRDLFPTARIQTVPNGTDPVPARLFQNPRPESMCDKTVLFSCGTFYERKGFPLLIDAFARVAPSHPGAVLRIAGSGEQRPLVQQRIATHGLEDRVTLLGQLSHEAVLQEMVWCDAFTLLGWDEPFGIVFAEAASCAKPIVCCDDCGFTDVLENRVHGLTVPPRDVTAAAAALDRLLSDAAIRHRLGGAARALFESKLRWDHNARNMTRIFEQAIGDAERHSPVPSEAREALPVPESR